MTPRGSLVYGDGSVAAIFIPGRNFYQIMLRGPPAGPALGRSVLADHPEYGYMAAFTWPEHERERFSPFFAPQGATPSQHPHADATGSQHFMCSPARNADSHRIRKRAAPDEEFGSSPSSPLRSVKRTRGMDEHEFGARRILRAVSHGQA